MKLRQTVLITILILSLGILLLGIIRFYPTLNAIFLKIHLNWNTYNKNNITFDFTLPSIPKGIILIIPDQRMNKYWNTYNIETNMGLKLSQLFYQKEFISIIFDRVDASIEPKKYFPPSKLKNQFKEILIHSLEWKKENFPNLKFHILAHGDGCNGLLMALKEVAVSKIDSIILTHCGYKDSLMDYYLSIIFYTMKLNQVEEEIINLAKKEALEWIKQNNYKTINEEEWKKIQKEFIEKNIHPDLIAFRKTLSTFQYEENKDFLLESKNIYFFDLLTNAINNQIKIFHIISLLDEEMPQEQMEAIETFHKKMNQPHYSLYILQNTDHFLFYLEKQLRSPMEFLIHRQNPFNKISDEFINIIYEILD